MAQLYSIRLQIEKAIKERGLDEHKTKGAIGLKSGLVISFIKPDTPDDPEKLRKLRLAIKEVLNINA